MAPRGCLVVVEGLDRSGKTTQCELLQQALQAQGHHVRYVKFPDRTTPTGQMINSYLTRADHSDDHSIHLIFAANRWEASQSIVQDLLAGTTIIVDRYSFSGAVYSAAKDNPNLGLEWAWAPEIGLPRPDLVLFLDISADKAKERGGYGAERYEVEAMQERVRDLFKKLFSRLDGLDLQSLDAGRAPFEVGRDIARLVATRMAGNLDQIGHFGALKTRP